MKNKEAVKLGQLRWANKTAEEKSEHGRIMRGARAKKEALDKLTQFSEKYGLE